MTEPLSLNQRPLGQKAKQLLVQAKADPDQGSLYVLQLAHWVLENKQEAIPGVQEREHANLMLDLVNQLFDRPPVKVNRMFLGPDFQEAGDEQEGEEQLLYDDPTTPEDLGVRLVENLYANLANQSPFLNPPHSLE